MTTPIPAATVVLFRDAAGGGPPELLMVERAKAMVFAGGALVFPGGRIDPGDEALAMVVAPDLDDGAARIAAVRETIEETGLPLGLDPAPDHDALKTLRAKLLAGASFGEALAAAATRLDLTVLEAFARWLPAHAPMRIFDTRFYLARAPSEVASVDHIENVRLWWASAAAVLAEADAERAPIIYPTRRNLERLALFASYDDAVSQARAHPVETITPFVETRDGIDHLCIPADLGYPVTSEAMSRAMRG